MSSALLRIEVIRAVDYIGIDDEVADAAMNESDRMLRSLAAIHLATARLPGTDLVGLVTYDDLLASAARHARITGIAPRD